MHRKNPVSSPTQSTTSKYFHFLFDSNSQSLKEYVTFNWAAPSDLEKTFNIPSESQTHKEYQIHPPLNPALPKQTYKRKTSDGPFRRGREKGVTPYDRPTSPSSQQCLFLLPPPSPSSQQFLVLLPPPKVQNWLRQTAQPTDLPEGESLLDMLPDSFRSRK